MKFHKTVLENGLTLIVVPKKSATAAAVFVTEAGGYYDYSGKEGMAHFCEHMPFKGTNKYPTPKDVVDASEGIGGQVNAHTDQEHMGFQIQVPPEKIKEGLEWLNQVALHALISAKEVEKERSVIIEEARMYIDKHDRFAYAKAIEVLYKGTRWGIPIEGTEETINNTSASDLKKFYKEVYHPKKSVIVVYGKVDPEKILALAQNLFGSWKKNVRKKLEIQVQKPKRPTNSLIVNERDVQQAYLTAMTNAVGEPHKEYYPAMIAKSILGSGFGSKLFREVREKHGLCYYIYASLDSYKRIGSLLISAGLNTNKIGKAGPIIQNEIDKMLKGKFINKEINRAKVLTRTAVLSVYDDPMAAAHRIASRFLSTGKIEMGEDVDTEIQRTTKETILKASKKILGFEKGVVSVVVPKGLDVSGLEAITTK